MPIDDRTRAAVAAKYGLNPDGTPLGQQAGPEGPDQSVVKNSLDRGVGGLAKDFGKLTEVLGAEQLGQGMQDWGQETVDQNPVQAESFGDAPLTWIAERGLESVPAVAGYMVPGGAAVKGAKLAKGLLTPGARVAAKQAGRSAAFKAARQAPEATKAARRTIGTKAGKKAYEQAMPQLSRGQKTAAAVTGMSAFGLPMHTGSNLNFQEGQGDELDLGRAFGAAIPSTALDTVGGIVGTGRKVLTGELGERARGEAINKMAQFRNIPKSAAKVSGQEAVIEGLQTSNQYLFASPNVDLGYERLSSPEGVEELLYSIGAGAAGGSMFGAASGVLETRAARNEKGRMATQKAMEDAAAEEGEAGATAGSQQAETAGPEVADAAGVDYRDSPAVANRKSEDPLVRARQAAEDVATLRDRITTAAAEGQLSPQVAARSQVALGEQIGAGIEALDAAAPETGQARTQVEQMKELYQRQAQLSETARVLQDAGQLDDQRMSDVSAEIARVQSELVDMLGSGTNAAATAQGAETVQKLDDLMREMRKGRELMVQQGQQRQGRQQPEPPPRPGVITPQPRAGQQQPRVAPAQRRNLPPTAKRLPPGGQQADQYAVGPDGEAAPLTAAQRQAEQAERDRAAAEQTAMGNDEVAAARGQGTMGQTDTSQLPRSQMTDADRAAMRQIIETADNVNRARPRNAAIAEKLADAEANMAMQTGQVQRADDYAAMVGGLDAYLAAPSEQARTKALQQVPEDLRKAPTPQDVVDALMSKPPEPTKPKKQDQAKKPAKKKVETKQDKAKREKSDGPKNEQAGEEAPAADADKEPRQAEAPAARKGRTTAQQRRTGQGKGAGTSRRDGQEAKASPEVIAQRELMQDAEKMMAKAGPALNRNDLREMLDNHEYTALEPWPFVRGSAIPWNKDHPLAGVTSQDPRSSSKKAPSAKDAAAVEKEAFSGELVMPTMSAAEWVLHRAEAIPEVQKIIEKEIAKPRMSKPRKGEDGETKPREAIPTGTTGVTEASWTKKFATPFRRIALLEFWAMANDKKVEPGMDVGGVDTDAQTAKEDRRKRAEQYANLRVERMREMFEGDGGADIANLSSAEILAMYRREMELEAKEQGIQSEVVQGAYDRVAGKAQQKRNETRDKAIARYFNVRSSVAEKAASGLDRGVDLDAFIRKFPDAPLDVGAINAWHRGDEAAAIAVLSDKIVSDQSLMQDSRVLPKDGPKKSLVQDFADIISEKVDSDTMYWSGAAPEGFGRGTTALYRAIVSGDGAAVHRQMAKMLSPAKELQPMVKWAKAALERSKIAYKPEMKFAEDGRPIHAEYNPKTDTITVYKGGEHPAIILHEAVHAATERSMAEAREAIDSGKIPNARVRKLVEAYRDLTKLYRDFKKEMPDSKSYGFTSEGEFVAEALSNPDFRAELQTKPETSLWGRLVEFVRKMIGLPKRDRDALHDVFTAAQTVAYNAPGASYMPRNMRVMMHTFSGPAEVARARRAAHELPEVKKWASWGTAKVRRAVLGFNTRHHITERFQNHLLGLKDFAIGNDKQSSLATTLNNNLGRFAGEHLQWMGKNKKVAEKLWTGLNLHSQFRLTEQQMYDLLDGKYTFDTLKKVKVDAAYEAGGKPRGKATERQWDMLGRQNFDRMVTSMRAAGWKPISRKLDPKRMQSWKANEWGHYIFQLSREDAKRTFEQQVRVAAFRATGDLKVNDMGVEAAIKHLKDNGDLSTAAETAIQDAKIEYEQRLAAPYVPSYRTGDYFASIRTVPDAEGKATEKPQTLMYMRFKTPIEAEAAAKDLQQQEQVKGAKDVVVTHGQIDLTGEDLENSDALLGMSRALVEKIEKSMPELSKSQRAELQQAAREEALRMLPETSTLKSYIHREGVPGWDAREQLEGFTMHMTQSNYSYANNRYLPDVEHALQKMGENVDWLRSPDSNKGNPEFEAQLAKLKKTGDVPLDSIKAGEVFEEMQRRFVVNTKVIESPFLDTLRSFTYNYQLAWSPGYLIANLTQPYVLSLPTLGARYGFRKGTKALMDGYGDATHVLDMMLKDGFAKPLIAEDAVARLRKAGKLSSEDIDVIEHMLESGKVEFTLAKEAGEISHGAESRARMARMLSAPAHYVEVINRMSSGLAAARLERARLKERGKLTEEGVEKVKSTSIWAIDETQFNYNRLNQSRLMSKEGVFGKMTPLFTVFLSYSINVMEKYARLMRASFNRTTNNPAERAEARRAFAGMLMTTGSLAGIGGLPFMGIIFAMTNILTEDEDDSEAQWRAWLANAVGKDAAFAMHYGLPAAAGLNVQQRVGQHDIMPFTRAAFGEKTLEEMTAAELLSDVSAALGTGIGMFNLMSAAPQWIANGDNSAGVDTIRAMPAAVRGVMTAAHGYYDPSGDPIPGEGGAMDKITQSLGFLPTQRHEQLFLALTTYHRDTRVAKNASHIRRNWVHSILDGDEEEIAEWREKAQDFVKRNPTQSNLLNGISEAVRRTQSDRALMALDQGYEGPLGVPLDQRQLREQQPVLDALKLGG